MTAILTSDWSRLTLLSLWPHYVRHIPRGALQTSLLPLCPESPKHLLIDKNDEKAAYSSLRYQDSLQICQMI